MDLFFGVITVVYHFFRPALPPPSSAVVHQAALGECSSINLARCSACSDQRLWDSKISWWIPSPDLKAPETMVPSYYGIYWDHKNGLWNIWTGEGTIWYYMYFPLKKPPKCSSNNANSSQSKCRLHTEASNGPIGSHRIPLDLLPMNSRRALV